MATFKTCVFKNHLRKDGTYNVKLRVTHNRISRKISTPYYVEAKYVTPNLEITDKELLGLCEDLCADCRKICRELGFTINRMSVDDLVHVLDVKLAGSEDFHLDFCKFWREQADTLSPGTRRNYIAALNAFQRFIGTDSFDIMHITSRLISEFMAFIEHEPSQRGSNRKTPSKLKGAQKSRAISLYIANMKAMYNRAKLKYNDEDYGFIPITRAPFSKIKLPEHVPAKRAISLETLQRIIDLPYRPDTVTGAKRYNLAKDCFIMSFGLIGMNSVDLYTCQDIEDGVLIYHRKKTCTRRADRAEMRVKIEPMIAPLMAKYKDPFKKRIFRFYLEYSNPDALNKAINKGLQMIAVELGLPALQYYAARHTWATIARSRLLKIEKATVHEALNHVDLKMRVTDMYIEKDWSVIWEAHTKVLALLKWPDK